MNNCVHLTDVSRLSIHISNGCKIRARLFRTGWKWRTALAIAQPSPWPKITMAYTRSGHTPPDESTSLCTAMMQSKDLPPTWSPVSTRDTLPSRAEYSIILHLHRPATTCDRLNNCTSPGYHTGLDVGLATELHKKITAKELNEKLQSTTHTVCLSCIWWW